MRSQYHIFVLDADAPFRKLLKGSLENAGYRVSFGENGNQSLALVYTQQPDLMLLDPALPDMDGVGLIRDLRAWAQFPIIVLSTNEITEDKVAALDAGANDYVTKPFDLFELLARIRVALRHSIRQEGADPLFKNGDLEVDLLRRTVSIAGRPVKLSPREYLLLKLFVTHADRVLTHQMILREVWGVAHINDTHYLRVFIRRLRTKIEPQPERPRLLITESGVGYRLRKSNEKAGQNDRLSV